jgi:hypothetical protein
MNDVICECAGLHDLLVFICGMVTIGLLIWIESKIFPTWKGRK